MAVNNRTGRQPATVFKSMTDFCPFARVIKGRLVNMSWEQFIAITDQKLAHAALSYAEWHPPETMDTAQWTGMFSVTPIPHCVGIVHRRPVTLQELSRTVERATDHSLEQMREMMRHRLIIMMRRRVAGAIM